VLWHARTWCKCAVAVAGFLHGCTSSITRMSNERPKGGPSAAICANLPCHFLFSFCENSSLYAQYNLWIWLKQAGVVIIILLFSDNSCKSFAQFVTKTFASCDSPVVSNSSDRSSQFLTATHHCSIVVVGTLIIIDTGLVFPLSMRAVQSAAYSCAIVAVFPVPILWFTTKK